MRIARFAVYAAAALGILGGASANAQQKARTRREYQSPFATGESRASLSNYANAGSGSPNLGGGPSNSTSSLAGTLGITAPTRNPNLSRSTSLLSNSSIQAPRPGGARQLRRNQSPTLSPYLNLVPGFIGSPEGQFLMRTLPQEEQTRTQRQTQRALQGIQGEIDQQERQIQTGIKSTGHGTSFMNTGNYFGGRR
ncbi:MAG: hypothetical protein ACKV0T_15440 [Planctomycetales bacterium]